MSKRPVSPDPEASPASKKSKTCNQKAYSVSFNAAWSVEFPWVKKSSKSIHHAFCSSCNVDFSIAHSGKYDVKQHALGVNHKKSLGSTQFNKKVTSFFSQSNGSIDEVTKAEVIFANFLTEHNIPFLVADHFTLVVKEMFPDSSIARQFSCRRMKSSYIVKKALAPSFDKTVTDLCQTQKFSLMIDESNDQGDNKTMTVLIRIFDTTLQKVTTKFLGLPICNIGTGENLFNCLSEIFV